MSRAKWTTEPWTIGTSMMERGNGVRRELTPVYGDSIATALVPAYIQEERPIAEANAARIVDCVNACAGMDDPAATLAQYRAVVGAARGVSNHDLDNHGEREACIAEWIPALRTALSALED